MAQCDMIVMLQPCHLISLFFCQLAMILTFWACLSMLPVILLLHVFFCVRVCVCVFECVEVNLSDLRQL